jgi:hypothetical protein
MSFPDLGTIYWWTDKSNGQFLAQGDHRIEKNTRLTLEVSENLAEFPEYWKGFGYSDLAGVILNHHHHKLAFTTDDPTFDAITRQTNLLLLDLEGGAVTPDEFKRIGTLNKLRWLKLNRSISIGQGRSGNFLTDDEVGLLPNLGKLDTLILERIKVGNSKLFLEKLGTSDIRRLVFLDCDQSAMTNQCLTNMKKLQVLGAIEQADKQDAGEQLNEFAALPNLKVLYLLINHPVITKPVRRFPKLKRLLFGFTSEYKGPRENMKELLSAWLPKGAVAEEKTFPDFENELFDPRRTDPGKIGRD